MRPCLLVVLSLLVLWATAFFSGLAYLQVWEASGSILLGIARDGSETSRQQIHQHSTQGRDEDGEWYQVQRTKQEKKDEEMDGYLITSDSPLIRQRVRGMCNASSGRVAWQRSYAALHRNMLALRRRINAVSERHKEEMEQKIKMPLAPQQTPFFRPGDDLRHVYGDHDGEVADEVMRSMTMKEEKYLVYSCLRGQHCGGWGDRMYGVMNAFFVALLTDRTFLIDWELPPPIEQEEESLPNGSGDGLGEEDVDKATTKGLADVALRTYIELVNGVKREVRSGNADVWSKKRRRLTIARLLEPTNIDWRFSKKDLVPLLKRKDTAYIDTIEMHASEWKRKPFTEVDIEQDMFENKKVVVWRTNNWYVNAISGNPRYRQKIIHLFGVDPASFRNMTDLQSWTSQLYGCFVNFLFRPVQPLRSIIAAHTERMHRGGFTLGLQLRMGGTNVRWSDPQRNDESDIPYFFRCARDLLYNDTAPVAKPIGTCELPKKSDAPWQVFIMTDSDDVKRRLKSKFLSKAITVDLPISHIERPSVGFESYVTIVVEAWLLGECDFILSSRSNLGWFAAKRTMHEFGTYVSAEQECFYNRGVYSMAPAFTYSQ